MKTLTCTFTESLNRITTGCLNHIKMIIFAALFVLSNFANAAAPTSGVTYTGRILDSNDQPVTASQVYFTITISDPDQKCWLYTEQRLIDMSASSGNFAFEVGSNDSTLYGVPSLNNPLGGGPATFSDVFDNSKSFTSLAAGSYTCPGNAYNPSTSTDKNEGRVMAIFFRIGAAGTDQALPALRITPVPFAMHATNAAKVGGYGSGELLKVGSTVNQAHGNLTQANYDEFIKLILGTSTTYLKTIPSLGGDISGTLPAVSVDKIKGVAVTAPVGGDNGKVLTYDSAGAGSLKWTTPAAGGITGINGQTGATQSFASGTAALTINSAADTHTLSIATATSSTNGILTSTDWSTFNSKQSNALNSAQIWVGNSSNGAQARTFSGDITVDNAGVTTLKNTGAVGTYYKVVTDAQGRVVSGTATASASDLPALNDGTVWIGNSSNGAVAYAMSGDATMSNIGVLALKNTGTVGTYYKVVTDAQGRVVSGSALASGDVTGALGYTPVNKAGDTMAGNLNLGAGNFLGLGSSAAPGTVAGQIWYNAGKVYYYNGASAQELGVAGAGITSFNGETGSSQSFAAIDLGTSVTAPAWSSATNVHTLKIPMASDTGVTAGLLSKADHTSFSGKLTSPLTTKGDLLSRDGTTHVRIPVGANNEVLMADSAQASGLKWAALPAAGITDLTGDVTATGPGSAAATIGAGKVTSSHILDGTIVGADMDFGGSIMANSGIVIKENVTGKFVSFACGTAGHVATWTVTGWSCQAPATAVVSDKAALASGKVWVGNASGVAQEQSVSGDATIDNAGALTLKNTGTVGTYTKVTTDAQGRVVSGGALAASDVTDALTYTPVNKAGDTMAGNLNLGAGNFLGLGSSAAPGTVAGQIWYNAGKVYYYNGASAQELGVAGAGITSFNGSTVSTQTLAAPGTSGNSPNWSTNTGTGAHTLNIPMASTGASVTAGLVSNADYASMMAKQSNTLTSAKVWIGNSSGGAEEQSISGDATITNAGVMTLKNTGTVGTYTKVITDAQGRVVSSGSLNAADITGALTYTPVNKAGDTMAGDLLMGGNKITGLTNVPNVAANPAVGDNGKSLRWNNGAGQWEWFTAAAAGAGITSLNSQSGNSQSFGAIDLGTSVTAPAWSSAADVHTLKIPMASDTGVTAGLLSKADHTSFSGKLTSPLTTKGDLLSRDGTTHVRVPVGANNEVLMADSAQASGLKWAALPAAGITDLTGDVTATGPGSAAATIGVGKVTSSHILNGTINGADMDFTGSNVATSSIVLKDSITGKFFDFNCSVSGQIATWTVAGWACQAPATAVVSDKAALANGKMWLGNGSNVASEVTMSGDATITNAGVLTLKNTGTVGTYTKVITDAQGRVVNSASLNAADITTALTYTPVNKAGDTMAGNLNLGAGNFLGLGASAAPGTIAGQIWYDAGNVKYYNGSTTVTLGVAGAGITSINGSTVSSQTFPAPGTSGTAPAWAFNAGAGSHTLNIPLASAGSVTAGLVSNADYTTMMAKQSNSLTAGQVWVGNSSNGAQAFALSGDIFSTSNTGSVTIVKSVTGTANQIVALDGSSVGTMSGLKLPSGAFSATLTAATTATGTYTLRLPAAQGSANQIMQNDGSGNLSWVSNVPSVNNASTLTDGYVWIGNGSNVAVQRALSGDATISNVGLVTLKSVGAVGTYTKVITDAQGRVVNSAAMNAADITGALAYTPVNKAGDTMAGNLNMGTNILGLGTSAGTVAGQIWYNAGKVYYRDGSGAKELGIAGASSGITSLNGSTVATQSFDVAPGGLAPAWQTNTGTGVHTLNIPMANTASVGAGLITNTEFVSFTGKLTSPLTTKGDILTRDGTTHVRLGVGTNNQVLTADSTQASGLKWAAIPTTGITDLTGDVTATGPGSAAATIGTGKVTSTHILDATILGADMNFTGANDANTGIVLKDNTGKFSNFACGVAGQVPTWTVSGWACQAPSGSVPAATAGYVWLGQGASSSAVAMSGDATIASNGTLTLNTVPVNKGGTGATTLDGAGIVTKTGNQTIAGNKDFTGATSVVTLSSNNITPTVVSINGGMGKITTGGQIYGGMATNSGNSVDFNYGNVQTTTYDCSGNLTLNNMQSGGSYTLVVTSTTTTKCTLYDGATLIPDNRFAPANTTRTASSATVYTMIKVGTVVYVSWITGFNP